LKYVRIIPTDVVVDYKKQAYEIIGYIDEDDVIFIATALAFNCPIWSEDKHFQKQNIVKFPCLAPDPARLFIFKFLSQSRSSPLPQKNISYQKT